MRIEDWAAGKVARMWMIVLAAQVVALLTVPRTLGAMLGRGSGEPASVGEVFAGIIGNIVVQYQAIVAILLFPPLVLGAITVTWAFQRRRRIPA
jgi:hypothetical protein